MRRLRQNRVLAVALALLFAPGPIYPQQESAPEERVIERLQVNGNRYLQEETYLFYVSTKAGDRFDLLRLRDDFRRLWNTGFLEDLAMDVSEGQSGLVVTFIVQERKRIQIVDYRGSKELKTTDIEEKLDELDAKLRLDSFYDINAARKVEEIITRLLAEKGHRFAEVKHDTRVLGGAGMQISFIIKDGPKAKVDSIEFVGNEIFSDGTLRGKMKKIKQPSFFGLTWLKGNTKFTDEKWEEDSASIRDFYLEKGYVDAQVGKPTLTYADEKPDDPESNKKITLSIPVDEGERYKVGKIDFEGLTVFREEWVRSLIKLEEGEYYDDSKVQKALEELQEAYGRLGHFQFTGYPERRPDPEDGSVDMTLHLEEDKRYFVGKIAFVGNDTTRDKVVRRELYMNEGDIFDTEALKQSIRRINQLGYFKQVEEAPRLAPSEDADNKIDVTFELQEENRNQVSFGGGVSGIEGTFLNLSFSTQNFLGKGETLQLAVQTGARTKTYQLAVTEPYFLDRPITAGFDVFRRRLEYRTLTAENVQGYVDDRVGFRVLGGTQFRRWGRINATYSFEVVKVEINDLENTNLFDPREGAIVPNNPFFIQDQGRRTESRIMPSISWNTVNNPFQPSAGNRQSVNVQFTGGPLGGSLDYIRPVMESVWYIPHTRRTSLGLRTELGWIFPYGPTAEIDPETGRNDLPFYLRFFMGGENQIRGYQIRSVGPRDENGFIRGGNKYFLFNAEYYVDIFGPLRFLLFFDAGQAYVEEETIDFKKLRTSTGAEVRFMMPVLNVPFRLIYAWNPHRDFFQPRTAFRFAVGTTF